MVLTGAPFSDSPARPALYYPCYPLAEPGLLIEPLQQLFLKKPCILPHIRFHSFPPFRLFRAISFPLWDLAQRANVFEEVLILEICSLNLVLCTVTIQVAT